MKDTQITLLLLVPLLLGFAGHLLKAGAISRIVFVLAAVGILGSGGFLFLSQ